MKPFAPATATAAALFVISAGAQTDAPDYAPHPAIYTESRITVTAGPLTSETLERLADSAEQAMVSEHYEKAADLFEQILRSGSFEQLDGDRRHFILSNAAKIASRRSDFTRAHDLYERSSQHRLAGSDDWMGRLNASWFLGDLDDAITSLCVIADTWPGELAYVSDWAMSALLDHLRHTDTDAEFDVLGTLFDISWQTDLGLEPSGIWLRFIELLLEKNATDQALMVAGRLRDPIAIVTLRSDRRFADIVAAGPDWFSIQEAMDAEIIEARLAVDANPHLLAPSVALAESLVRAGRQQEALLVINTQLARSALKSVIGEHLDDSLSEAVNALTIKAVALIALGQFDLAAQELELAARQMLPTNRLDDFLTVAELQASLGLPRAALKTLDRINARADDARMLFIRFVAARLLRDSDAENLALDALLARASDSPVEAQRALLLAGEKDAAATVLISRLSDPKRRPAALLELQRMKEQVWPASELDWRASLAAIAAREDVRETIAANGGLISDYEIYRWN